MLEKKSPMQSWTLWFNLAMSLIVEVVSTLSEAGVEGAWMVHAMTLANMALRLKTKQPVI